MLLALLYDIHGNLPALEAVLADAKDADGFVLGGDYATAGAWPKETVARLKQLENATWIRGNADRWLVDRHDAPAPIDDIAARTADMSAGGDTTNDPAGNSTPPAVKLLSAIFMGTFRSA